MQVSEYVRTRRLFVAKMRQVFITVSNYRYCTVSGTRTTTSTPPRAITFKETRIYIYILTRIEVLFIYIRRSFLSRSVFQIISAAFTLLILDNNLVFGIQLGYRYAPNFLAFFIGQVLIAISPGQFATRVYISYRVRVVGPKADIIPIVRCRYSVIALVQSHLFLSKTGYKLLSKGYIGHPSNNSRASYTQTYAYITKRDNFFSFFFQSTEGSYSEMQPTF